MSFASVLLTSQLHVLFAGCDREMIAAVEPWLRAMGALVEVGEGAAGVAGLGSPGVVLVDPAIAAGGAGIRQLHAAVGERFPVVMVTDTVTPRWRDCIAEELIDDVFPVAGPACHFQLRLEMVWREFSRRQELKAMREAARQTAPTDPLTGIYYRAALLPLLFRETDRVQRMGVALAMIAFDVDGRRSGGAAGTRERQTMREVVPRLNRLLRSYDLVGEVKRDTFLIALPGCNEANAVRLAERARAEVFSAMGPGKFGRHGSETCFGVVESHGRSPLVVVREAEQLLERARAAGAGTIWTRDGEIVDGCGASPRRMAGLKRGMG